MTLLVLAPNSARAFKVVFEAAQEHLERVFGMAMTELPSKEKVTIAQKRAAQKASGNSQGNQSSSKAYVLTSTLPSVFRNPIILHPPRMPTTGAESGYIGLYSFIVSVIYLSEGSRISEGKLERYLKRCNADTYVMNGEKTENVLKKMEKHGYIVKIKDREPGGEEIVDWVVGPRGKVEVGEKGVASMVRNVYGKRDVEMDQLEDKLEKSLGAGTFRRKTRKHGEEEEREGEGGEGAHNGEHNPRTATQATPQTRSGTSQGRTRNTRDKAAKQPQPRRSSRRTSGFVDDEAEGEDGEADEPDEAENYEEGDEDEGEDEGYY